MTTREALDEFAAEVEALMVQGLSRRAAHLVVLQTWSEKYGAMKETHEPKKTI